MAALKEQTTLSTKGQVVLPTALRRALGWKAGEKLIVEQDGSKVVLRRARVFKPTRVEDVAGMLKYDGPPKTIEEMDEGIAQMFRDQHARGRY